jgi:hypothetical protein
MQNTECTVARSAAARYFKIKAHPMHPSEKGTFKEQVFKE